MEASLSPGGQPRFAQIVVFERPVVFLAILSPAVFEGPALIDVSNDEPWRSLKP